MTIGSDRSGASTDHAHAYASLLGIIIHGVAAGGLGYERFKFSKAQRRRPLLTHWDRPFEVNIGLQEGGNVGGVLPGIEPQKPPLAPCSGEHRAPPVG